jgi:zinc/manganese transport system permease protein
MIAVAMAIAAASCIVGLLVSFHIDVPSSPAIILAAGFAYLLSVAFGRETGRAARRAAAA